MKADVALYKSTREELWNFGFGRLYKADDISVPAPSQKREWEKEGGKERGRAKEWKRDRERERET